VKEGSVADFLKFFNTSGGIKISAVSNNYGSTLISKTFKTESLVEASGLNSVYDNRFPANSGASSSGGDADTLNTRPGYWYTDRQNHSGTVTAATDAFTLNTRSGYYYLDRVNQSGNVNSQSVYFSGISYTLSSGVDFNNNHRSGTYIVNWRQSNLQTITLSGNTTLVFSGAMNGSKLQLIVNQDSVGSRTITWPSSVKWPSATAPTLTTTQSGVDIVAFYTNNSNYYGTSATDFR
jgi:hypothetical protein